MHDYISMIYMATRRYLEEYIPYLSGFDREEHRFIAKLLQRSKRELGCLQLTARRFHYHIIQNHSLHYLII